MAEFAKRWLKITDAAEYSSIGRHRLRELVLKKKAIKGFIDPDSKRGDVIIDRLSLDDYRESQYKEFVKDNGCKHAAEKAANILQSL